MSKTGRNDPCPCGSGRKYKKCCLAETLVQVGKEEPIRKLPVDDLLEFHNTDTFQDLTEAIKAHEDQPPNTTENDIPMETRGIGRERRTRTELTSAAKKIMELFRYFRIKKGEYLSVKLIRSKQYLWRDIEEQEFNEAVDDLIQLGYIEKIENPEGWKLLGAGDDKLRQLTLPL